MTPMSDRKEQAAEAEKSKQVYEDFMARPEIQMLFTLLPPAKTDVERDCLITLIKAAIASGVGLGQGLMAAKMFEQMTAARSQSK